MALASSLSIYASTPLNEALKIPTSLANDFFDSKPFCAWRQCEESKMRMQSAAVERLNMVIRGCNAICKTVSRVWGR